MILDYWDINNMARLINTETNYSGSVSVRFKGVPLCWNRQIQLHKSYTFFFPEVGNIVFRGNDCLRASKPTKTKNFFKYYENQAKQTNKQNFNTTKNIVQQNTKTSDGLG